MTSYMKHITPANIKAYWPQIAGATGAVVVIYGVSVLVYDLTSTLVNLSFEQVFYTGFFVGLGSAAVVVGAGLWAYRAVTLSPSQVFRAAMAKLQKSEAVRSKLGPHVNAGPLRAYYTVPGHLAVAKGSLAPTLVAPHTQMLFQIVGEWGEGMVSVEALKYKGKLKFNFVAVDVLGSKPRSAVGGAMTGQAASARPGELLLVAGTEEKLHVVGTLRGFLQAERAAYIPQDKAQSDDEWIAEQEVLPEEPEEAGEGATGDAQGKEGEQRRMQ